MTSLHFWKIYNFLDDCWCDLQLKQFLIVVNQWNDCVFSTNIVGSVCRHCMIKVEVDPLTYIQFVLVVPNTNYFDQVVYFLAYSCNNVISCDFIKFKITEWEWKVDNVYQGFNNIQFSHQFLPQLKILITLMLYIILIFRKSTGKVGFTLMANRGYGVSNQELLNIIQELKNFSLLFLWNVQVSTANSWQVFLQQVYCCLDEQYILENMRIFRNNEKCILIWLLRFKFNCVSWTRLDIIIINLAV